MQKDPEHKCHHHLSEGFSFFISQNFAKNGCLFIASHYDLLYIEGETRPFPVMDK